MKPIFASFVLLAACGAHSALDPGSGNDPGTGTNTLFVKGSATAEPNIPNSGLDTSFTTHFDVEISLNNVPVTAGTVTMTSRTGMAPLTYRGSNTNRGQWDGTIAYYDGVYQLDITSGPDKISGVRVDGPDIHVFTAPLAGATMNSTMANPAAWNRVAPAQLAVFEADSGKVVIADSGTYSIPPGSLKTDNNQSRPNTLRLTRTDTVIPAGAVAGSTFTVGVAQEIDVVALPCPGC